MADLLKEAWNGFREQSGAGKLIGLLLAVQVILILFGVIGLKRKKWAEVISDVGSILCPEQQEKGAVLALYTMAMLAVVVCPVTAVIILFYQTRFYNYSWIFSYIPVTLMLGLGLSAMIFLIWKMDLSKKGVVRAGISSILILFVIFLCGAQKEPSDERAPIDEYRKTTVLLQSAAQETDAEKICLWAPKEILESARCVMPSAKLIYGRNMWDNALNAYCYDKTSDWQKELYVWMENANRGNDWEEDDRKIVESALSHGVNVIMLASSASEAVRKHVEDIMDAKETMINNTYIFIRNTADGR